MNTINYQEKIYQLLEQLIEVPDMDRIIYFRLKELENKFQKEITQYSGIKKFFKNQAYGQMTLCTDDTDTGHWAFLFVLIKKTGDEFDIARLEPEPPPGMDINHIIPKPVISYMQDFKPHPSQMVSKLNLSIPGLKERTFDLRFAVISKEKIIGVIKEKHHKHNKHHQENKIDHREIEKENTNGTANKNTSRKLQVTKYDYRELFEYMERNPFLKKTIFSNFYLLQKPGIDKTGDKMSHSSSS